MNVEKLHPPLKSRVSFRLRDYNLVPKVSGCYVLTSMNGDIVYIGLTKNLHRRFQEHLDNPQKTGMTRHGKVIWFYFMECKEIQLEQVERTWLNTFQIHHGVLPELNKHQSPLV